MNEQEEVRNAVLGMLNGCGLGSVLWAVIIGLGRMML